MKLLENILQKKKITNDSDDTAKSTPKKSTKVENANTNNNKKGGL